jgi:hypothetical protein
LFVACLVLTRLGSTTAVALAEARFQKAKLLKVIEEDRRERGGGPTPAAEEGQPGTSAAGPGVVYHLMFDVAGAHREAIAPFGTPGFVLDEWRPGSEIELRLEEKEKRVVLRRPHDGELTLALVQAAPRRR